MRLLADRTKTHRSGRKSLHNRRRRLHFIERNRRTCLELQQAAERCLVGTALILKIGELPVRAGGGAAATVIGEALGLVVSAAVAAWSAISHDRQKPEIESQVRVALNDGLEQMWAILMEDPELGVMYPVNHMSGQIEAGLFAVSEPEADLPF